MSINSSSILFLLNLVSSQIIDCPAKCNCGYYVDALFVDCKRAGFTSIPDLPANVEYLYLQHNDLRWLDEGVTDFKKYENLTYIKLENNPKLSGISRNFFSNNKKLEFVFMKNTGIINFSGFEIPNLSILEVNSDSMESFDFDSFVDANKKTNQSISIKIGGENLESIKAENKFSMTQKIDISIQVSESGKFDITRILAKFVNAQTLQMYSKWDFIGDLSLAKLTFSQPFYDELKTFNLFGFGDVTKFLKLPKNVLPRKLRSLTLIWCQISDQMVFNFVDNFELIENLVMSNNLLTKVPFEKLNKHLEKIDLSKNLLKHFDASRYSLDNSRLERFYLDGNPFECNCDDLDHQNYLDLVFNDTSSELWNDFNYECSNYEGLKIVDVDFSHCNSEVSTSNFEQTTVFNATTASETTPTTGMNTEPVSNEPTTTHVNSVSMVSGSTSSIFLVSFLIFDLFK